MDFTTTQTNQIARWILSGVQNKTRFLVDSVVEVDHRVPHSMGEKDEYANLQLLHKHCHVEKTKVDDFRKQTR